MRHTKTKTFSPEILAQLLEHHHIAYTEAQLAALSEYIPTLIHWNKAINLIGKTNWIDAFNELILDCIHLATFFANTPLKNVYSVLDLGAGAGLPGIPLRIFWSQGTYTMIEAREKRVLFLQNILAKLKLPNTTAIHARAEEFMSTAAPVECVVSRAFLPWNAVLSLAEPFIKPQGFIVFMCNGALPKHLPEQWVAIKEHAYPVAFSSTNNRYFWLLQKQ